MAPTPERRFGRYVVVDRIGSGAMGLVYRARDPELDRIVAIKVIRTADAGDPKDSQRVRFLREAKAIARLAHPAIVAIHDLGEQDGQVFFVMEYVEGRSLRDVLRVRRQLPVVDTIRIVTTIADGLGYAHEHGLVHRDVKPDNILFEGPGLSKVKLADFGIAASLDSHMTATGMILGTPAYMSPEQWRGERVDARADVFAVGVLLYEMLTGMNPFRAENSGAILNKVLHVDPPAPSTLVPGVSAALDQLLARALAKDRAARFENGSEVATALTTLGRTGPAADDPVAAAGATSRPSFPAVRLASGQRGVAPALLPAVASCLIGSGPESDTRLDSAGVQPRHARIFWRGTALMVEPVGEARVAVNGTAVTEAAPLDSGDWLALGQTAFQLVIAAPEGTAHASPAPPPTSRPAPAPASETAAPRATGARSVAIHAGGGPRDPIVIGRLPDCGVQIASPTVSRRHARITWHDDRWTIEDLGSTNGTFVNGERVVEATRLAGGERVQVGSFTLVFANGALREVEGTGRVRIEARNLTKTVVDTTTGKPKHLLDGIDLVVEPGEFVGIFGTSGSGKSTLMDALNGRRPATAGHVRYNETDLYRAFDLFKSTIGYVPQQDIVHRKIAVSHALAYTARLRLPPDTSAEEIDAYVARVLARVGLAEKAMQPIDTPVPLSGGQLKRVSLAVELVSNPSVLFLDEATSGLDAGTDKRMMRLFADLAADAKTVVCVTHTLENIDSCRLVAVLFQGRLVYYGPPAAVTDHFEIGKLSDVYEVLERAPAETWAERYAQSSFHREYVAARLGPEAPPRERAGAVPEVTTAPGNRRWLDLRQTGILSRRYLDLIVADRRNLAVLLLQAPIIGALIGLVFDTSGPLPKRVAAESQIGFLMVISAIWFGCLNSVREIVKELPIYRRERTVNLAIAPYVLSKMGPLTCLCVIQCVVLLAMVTSLLSLPGATVARIGPLVLTGMAATAMGLALSAFVTSVDKAVAAVPILLIPQVILSGAIVDLAGTSERIAKATMISYWGFDGIKTTLEHEVRQGLTIEGSYALDLAILGLFFAAFLLCSIVGLRLKDRLR